MSEKEITTGEDGRLYIEHGGKLYKMPEGSRAGYVYCDIQQDTGTAQSDPPKRPAIHIEQMSNSQSLILIGEGPRMTSIMAAAWYPRCIEWVLERLQGRFDWGWLDGPRLSLFVEEVGTGWTEKGDRHD